MPKRLAQNMEDEVVRLYHDGFGTNTIAERIGVHRGTVQRCLKRQGVTLRKTSPYVHYDVHHFDHYTPSSCYWAGFIAADGYITPERASLVLHLSEKDAVHSRLFATTIGLPEDRVAIDKDGSCRLTVCGEWYVDQLLTNFHIGPNKTTRTIIPNLPQEMLPHFVRGYFDGDGAVLPGSDVSCINFTSCSGQMLVGLQELFFELGVRLKSRNHVPPIQNGVQMSYSGKNAGLIVEWMYKESTPCLRLQRKYEKCLECFPWAFRQP